MGKRKTKGSSKAIFLTKGLVRNLKWETAWSLWSLLETRFSESAFSYCLDRSSILQTCI